jgi:hypothetical protein
VQNRGGYDRSWLVDGCPDHSAVSDGAERTFMTGKFGIVSMDVNGLDETAESNQKHADQAQSPDGPTFVRFGQNSYQTRMSWII